MAKSLRAGRVVAPERSTCASMLPRTPTSRSVVVSRISPSLACSNTFDKIGSVVRVLTTFWTVERPSSNLSLLTLNFILWGYQITCPKSPQAPGTEGQKRRSQELQNGLRYPATPELLVFTAPTGYRGEGSVAEPDPPFSFAPSQL